MINLNLNFNSSQNLCTAQVVNVTPRYARLKAADDREVQHLSSTAAHLHTCMLTGAFKLPCRSNVSIMNEQKLSAV